MISFRGRDIIYLDNAATSLPKPPEVVEAVAEALLRAGNPGRSGHSLSFESMRDIFETREVIAELIGCSESKRIIFTSNATVALNLAIKGLLRERYHVITTVMEHNSVLRPLSSMAHRGVEITYVEADPRGNIDPYDVKRSFKKNTRLVAMIHASNVTGTVYDIAEVGAECRRREVPFLVDASQTAGAVEIDVKAMNIDLLAASGHKALFGPQGTGFLYVGENVEVRPLFEGGTGSRSENDRQPDFLPDRLEAGTPNSVGLAGLRRGAEYVRNRGVEKIMAHESELLDLFLKGVKGIDRLRVYGSAEGGEQLGVLLFNVEGMDPGELSMQLDEDYGILVRSGLHCAPSAHRAIGTFPEGGARISFSALNTLEEAEKAVAAIREICKRH